MSAPAFTPGQTVYDRSGRKFEFAEALSGDRVLCRQIYFAQGYEGSDEEYPSDEPTILYAASLYAAPPVESIAQEVADKQLELAEVKRALADAMQDVRGQEREKAERLAALKDHPKLARLEDFLAGRITHFVVTPSYGETVSIQTLAEFLKYRDGYSGRDDGFKLLTLFGKVNGELQWAVNHYPDGSGSSVNAEPVTSYEEAMERAASILDDQWQAWRASPAKYRWLKNPIDAADKLGIPVPEDARVAFQEAQQDAARAEVEKAAAKLAEAEAALAKARGEQVPA